jgi:5'(3')-deoxyribonucleotidase
MKNKIITIDCDDVLSETIDALLKYYDYNIKWVSIYRKDVTFHEFDKIKRYHYTFDERIDTDMDFFLHKDALHKIHPLKWAKEKILELKKMGYKIYVVTWRWDNLKAHTFAWLDLNYPNMFDGVCFSNADNDNYIPKSKFCKDLWSEFMVEDDLRYARDVASKWIKVYLLDKPWNQHYDKTIDKWIIKIKYWSEIDC